MIHNSIGSGRRILTFPAVHPCEATSSTTLLNSLIDLSENICSFLSKFFPSNSRNARETIRQIRNLSLVLVELRDVGSDLPGSIILCLSELHLIFQKARYLLEDCTREGARLWMLMKSDRVASEFRGLVRAIATALDVLQLESVAGVSSEVKELVQLEIKQARKGRFEVDPDDKRFMGDVLWILHQLEDSIIPDKDTLKQVLDYLGIRRWSECNKEIKFLDAEIAIECSNVEKRGKVSLLSGLTGLLSYSRCVLFDSVDSPKLNEKGKAQMLNGLDPDDFRCPITLEYMKDPVTIETGHTYDRSSILKWFRAGNRTCPKTGERLTTTELVPNLVLKELIQQYGAENGIPMAESAHKNRDIKRTVVAGSLAAEGAFRLASNFLASRLVDGDDIERIKSAYEVRLLAKASIFNMSCLTEAGVIPPLLKLLLSSDALAQENAIAALLNLSKHTETKAIIVDNGGLDLIVEVLKKGPKVESRQHAAATLFYIASIEEYRKVIGEIPDAIPALVELIKEGNDRCKRNAIVALFGLLMHSDNHWRVLAAGAVPLLLNLLTSAGREDLITDSLAVLATLAEKLDGAIAIVHFQPLPIIGVLDSSSSRTGKEYCVSLLLALCLKGGPSVVATLVKSPTLMGSLYSILSEGTSRASKKASALINILHEFCEKTSSSSMRPPLPREQFIHAW
ncbi:hypothetical protein HS088_TW22G00433 [Tripterygium wilfordii]|uniref:RING-type E3 ubiquitin transferase n=1 Tax=Tripterygium wilfordii TaxID=458696 RepID=A0A7J7BY11_TRIWF|nr:U-box domain-containing protein 19 [Tripterygium wilfordii]KAF5726751.1 hypothetical protein HS088_TW22G00433 [Tripterygium wilfordii]